MCQACQAADTADMINPTGNGIIAAIAGRVVFGAKLIID